MLTSLKKTMGVGKKHSTQNKKVKKAKRSAYLINLDLKTNRLIKIKKVGILLRYFIKGYIFKYVRALKLIY